MILLLMLGAAVVLLALLSWSFHTAAPDPPGTSARFGCWVPDPDAPAVRDDSRRTEGPHAG